MGDDFRVGAERCQWISTQTVALFYPKCTIAQTTTVNVREA